MMKHLLCVFGLLLSGFIQAGSSVDGVPTLPQLANLLAEAESVEIHKASTGSILVSWPSDDDRKLSAKTLRIVERIAGVVKADQQLRLFVSVSAEAQDANQGLSQLNSEYKATYIEKALVKHCAGSCDAYVVGVGDAVNANKVFVAIARGEHANPSLMAFD